MRIINIINRSQTGCYVKNLGVILACVILFSGCVPKYSLKRAEEFTKTSADYYSRAVWEYQNLIAQGKDADNLNFELGKLLYNHGDFKKAIDAFKKTQLSEAKKYLAISFYHTGNFTDALEVFNKQESGDDEYLYYQALTCEKLNLFDRALKIYKSILGREFLSLAKAHIDAIEKEASSINIKEISKNSYDIISSAPAAEKYPQAGALILSCDEETEISSEGTEMTTLHYLIKILNERGKERFSETSIDYDSTFEKVELEFARTIKPDGTVVEVGKRHIRDVSKYLNFPLYSNVRAYIISFPEIADGAVIEYKVKVYNNQLINKKDFVLSYPVQSGEPIIDADFRVSIPKERKLNIKIINEKYNDFGAKLAPEVEEKDGRAVYHWQFKDIPQIIPEADMPPAVQINPTLLISTFDSWVDIYDWWWQLAKDKIKADSAIKEKLTHLLKGKQSDEEKTRSIYNFCAKDIRYVAVEYGQAGYEPHQASDIFKNKYGDCKDQAILLVTMLKEAGLSASPVLIATKDYYNMRGDFPSVLFNHCIASVSINGKIIFLDPTAETCSFGDLPAGDQKRDVLVFTEEGFKLNVTPLFPAGHNLNSQNIAMKVNDDESISAAKTILTEGVFDQAQRYWLLYTQPELIQETLKQKIQSISIGAKLIKYNIENAQDLNKPVVLSYEFSGPEYFTEAGALRIMPQLSSIDTSLVAKEKRKYAIDFSFLNTGELAFEIEIPKGFAVKFLPESVARESRWMKFNVEYSQKENKIYFKQKTELEGISVAESEYAEFKKFIEELARQIKQRVVLERAPG